MNSIEIVIPALQISNVQGGDSSGVHTLTSNSGNTIVQYQQQDGQQFFVPGMIILF